MIEVRKTEVFSTWLDALVDLRARARIQARIERLAGGDKGSQAKAIRVALRLGRNLSE